MNEYEEIVCSFCLKEQSRVGKLIDGGDSVYICNECVELCSSILNEEKDLENTKQSKRKKDLYPKDIYKFLSEYIIGQEAAKKVISVGIYNHYKRLENLNKKDIDNSVQVDKSNILLVGPTGSGKTLIAKTVAKILDLPFIIADATSLTEAGYVGDDVESILLRLLQASNNNVKKAEKGIVYIDEIDKIASAKSFASSVSRDVSGEGVQQSLLKIMEGSNLLIGKKHPQPEFVQIDTTNILFICGGSFNGIEKIIEERTTEKLGLGFGASIKGNNTEIYTAKRKNDLLSKLTTADLIKFGMIPEFIGRLPILASLQDPNQKDLVKILTAPKNSLTKQYKAMMSFENINLDFSKDSLQLIAQQAFEKKIGARGLRSIIDNLLLDCIFDIKKSDSGSSLKVETKTTPDNNKILTVVKKLANKITDKKTKKIATN